jgi:hypothetical protein
MELLKVFVGDGTASPASVAAMTKGDVLLLNAKDYTPYTSGSGDVVIAVCTDKGVEYSSPIKKTNVLYGYFSESVPASEAGATATIGTANLIAGETYTMGVQIKEDLRMGTYNKNTEILASYVVPSTAVITNDAQDLTYKNEMASVLAKGFSANPLTSAGSPYQLINVDRSNSGTVTALAASGATVSVIKGAREITINGAITNAPAVGGFLSISGKTYLVEKYTVVSATVKIVSLDTAYQGATAAALSANTGGVVGTQVPTDTWVFNFASIAQTMKNRYDQFRMVDFEVITPKGNYTGLITIAKTAPTYPVGSYRQVRDLEEKAYTNANPLINYREFPFEDFVLNADSTQNSYCLLTLTYNLTSGYNYLQSNSKEFPQTLVVAAPASVDGLFDRTPSSGSTFASLFNTWYGSTLITSNPA